MIPWIFAGISVLAAAVATFVTDVRRAILSLWVGGLAIGGFYLTLGAELLATIQWIVSTLVAISFVFFAVMFGEFGAGDQIPLKKRIVPVLLPILVGLGFAATIWLGTGKMPENITTAMGEGSSLAMVGKSLTEDHLISLEVLALTLFLVLVGGGVIARPEGKSPEELAEGGGNG